MKYYIEFNTKEAPGLIISTSVEIKSEWIRPSGQKMNIALCDSPLYKKLEAYVLANPSKKVSAQ